MLSIITPYVESILHLLLCAHNLCVVVVLFMPKVACTMRIWRRILVVVLVLVRCRLSTCFTVHRSNQLYGGNSPPAMPHQVSLRPVSKPSILQPKTARQLQPLEASPLSWLADKAKELIKPPRILQRLAKHVTFKRRPALQPVSRQPPQKFEWNEAHFQQPPSLTRKPAYEALAGVDLSRIAFPSTT